MPNPGANIRLYTVALSRADSAEKRKIGTSSKPAVRRNSSQAVAPSAALSTARVAV